MISQTREEHKDPELNTVESPTNQDSNQEQTDLAEINESSKNNAELEKALIMMNDAPKSPNLRWFLKQIIKHCEDIDRLLGKMRKLKEELRLLYKSKDDLVIPKMSARYYSSYSPCPYYDFRCRGGFVRAAPIVVFLDMLRMPCGYERR